MKWLKKFRTIKNQNLKLFFAFKTSNPSPKAFSPHMGRGDCAIENPFARNHLRMLIKLKISGDYFKNFK